MRVFVDKITGSIYEVTNTNLYSVYENSPAYEEVKEVKEPKKNIKSK